jgi:hypothetical protein
MEKVFFLVLVFEFDRPKDDEKHERKRKKNNGMEMQ